MAGHRRHGARRADRDDQRLPGPRALPRRARADHRPADEPRLRPSRRRRPGPPRGRRSTRSANWIKETDKELAGVDKLLRGQPIWVKRLKDVGWIGVEGCLALGVTGPMLRAAGLPWDLRKTEPYLGYETFDFEVPTDDGGDCWSRFVVKVAEMRETIKIIEQVLDRLEHAGPVMVDDPKIAWPAQLSIGSGRHGQLGRARPQDHERLDGVADPPLQAGHRRFPGADRTGLHADRESPRGELGAHVVSDGGTRPYRVHLRDPSSSTCRRRRRCRSAA